MSEAPNVKLFVCLFILGFSGILSTLLMPLTIPVNSPITITIPESVGIVNPGSGVYTLSVLTTQDQVAATISYDIVIKIIKSYRY